MFFSTKHLNKYDSTYVVCATYVSFNYASVYIYYVWISYVVVSVSSLVSCCKVSRCLCGFIVDWASCVWDRINSATVSLASLTSL